MKLQGEFAFMASGPVSDQTRRAFEANGLTPPKRGGLGAGAGGPVEDVVVAWFHLEQVSPGMAGALAAAAVQAVTYVVGRMTKWFRSGESPAPEARNHIIVRLGGTNKPSKPEADLALGRDYSVEKIAVILRTALSYQQSGPARD